MEEEQKTEEIVGPAGPKPALNMKTLPLLGIKLKREVGIVALGLIATMMTGIMYSLYHRGDVNQKAATEAATASVTPSGQSGAAALKRELADQEDQRKRVEQGKLQAANPGAAITGPDTTPDGYSTNSHGVAGQSGVSNQTAGTIPPVVVRSNGDTVRLPARGPQGQYGGQAGNASNQTNGHVPTPEELYRAKQLEAYNAALVADTSAGSSHGSHQLGGGSGFGGGNGVAPSSAALINDAVNRVSSQLAGRGGSNSGTQGSGQSAAAGPGFPGSGSDNGDQNRQEQKVGFAYQSTTNADTLSSTREPALSRYEIRAGWDIPATLEGGLNSDLPGNIKAIVRENVYDTATGRFLLIPQGSLLIGIYNSQVTYGQGRVQVVWSRLIYPDGTAVSLGNMPGVDAEGYAGFHDKVNNHFARLVSEALLASAFAAGVGLSQKQNTNALSTPSNGQLASQAIGQQLGQLGSEITNKNLSIQPTIIVRPGYRFDVRVTKDIVFNQPYTPLY
jgi:type IV secretory pathway VirB10-like protein